MAGLIGGLIYGNQQTYEGDLFRGPIIVGSGLAGALLGVIVFLLGYALWRLGRRLKRRFDDAS